MDQEAHNRGSLEDKYRKVLYIGQAEIEFGFGTILTEQIFHVNPTLHVNQANKK
jgi:hypothetical protein